MDPFLTTSVFKIVVYFWRMESPLSGGNPCHPFLIDDTVSPPPGRKSGFG